MKDPHFIYLNSLFGDFCEVLQSFYYVYSPVNSLRKKGKLGLALIALLFYNDIGSSRERQFYL
jgi:hypothetical protein